MRRNYDYSEVHRSYRKLAHRLERNNLSYDKESFDAIGREIEEKKDYDMNMVLELEKIFN